MNFKSSGAWLLVLFLGFVFTQPLFKVERQLLRNPYEFKIMNNGSPSLSLVGTNSRFTEHYLKRAHKKKEPRRVFTRMKDVDDKLHRFYNRFTYG
ncbi:Neuropeptide-Like Protein [Caenorhabditis elegans]|uniref:Neuropeptide-Like Protein n=2 Tax=Caenorhabditis elegans TaxID=6239 RepID=O16944_CAEEL|nr:Neuropeptide-Like Protein [Caenorhabditis elegans]CCD71082.1 Neuropeptide-Like Protein [Caenorhabditis elegans]|eukprot:NP_503342.2 Uncharacterized protein CELE_K09C6.3 [Caenorhabditis elegans]